MCCIAEDVSISLHNNDLFSSNLLNLRISSKILDMHSTKKQSENFDYQKNTLQSGKALKR